MRRTDLQGSQADAWGVFARVPVAHLVTAGAHVRPVHPIVVDGRVCWHGALKGEKADWDGPVAVSAHEVVASIPSTWRHPERACPATTYYRSAEVRGPAVLLDGDARVRALAALSGRYQPEGGYRPIDASDPMYTGAVRGVGVWAVDGVPVGRVKLGQTLTAPERHAVLAGLWARGAPGDDAAIEAIVQASGGAPLPGWLQGPGVRLIARVPDDRVEESVGLVRDAYWNTAWSDATIADAHRGAAVWVGADVDGRLVGTARALSDGGKMSYVGDVAVHPDWRGTGVGAAVMGLLLDHPLVRRTRWTTLHTRDAQGFYVRLGFQVWSVSNGRTEMRRWTDGAPPAAFR